MVEEEMLIRSVCWSTDTRFRMEVGGVRLWLVLERSMPGTQWDQDCFADAARFIRRSEDTAITRSRISNNRYISPLQLENERLEKENVKLWKQLEAREALLTEHGIKC